MSRLAQPRMQVFNSNGDPLPGAQMEFYESGTTTPKDTFSDDGLTSANANPVVADSSGRFGDIFLAEGDYRVILKDSGGSTIWSADGVRSPTQTDTSVLNKTTTYTVSTGDGGRLIAADATSGGFTITLPSAGTAGNGFEVVVIKTDASSNEVTVDGNGSQTINGSLDLGLTRQFDSAKFRSTGSAWLAHAVDATPALPAGYFGPVSAANATDTAHDITLSWTGSGATQAVVLSSVTKQIDDDYAFGADTGGMFTGSVATSTVYYLIAISRDSDDAVDWGFDTDPAGANAPSGFTFEAMLGAIVTDGSSEIINDRFMLVQPDGSQVWRSEALTIPTTGVGSNLATGLTKDVTDYSLILECNSSDAGFAVGERVMVEDTSFTAAYGHVVVLNTNREVRLITGATNGIRMIDAGGAISAITESRWNAYVNLRTAP